MDFNDFAGIVKTNMLVEVLMVMFKQASSPPAVADLCRGCLIG